MVEAVKVPQPKIERVIWFFIGGREYWEEKDEMPSGTEAVAWKAGTLADVEEFIRRKRLVPVEV